MVEKIEENPYILTNIKGIGFKKADEIAQSIGIDRKSQFRISACLNFILNEYCNSNGNSSIGKKKIFMLLDDALGFEKENTLYQNTLNDMVRHNDIFKTTQHRFAPSMLYHAEKKIMKNNSIDKKKIEKFYSNSLEHTKAALKYTRV